MNVLFLHSSSDLYGASKILLTIVRILKKNGHTPIVVLSEEGPLSEQLTTEGIEVIFIRLGIIRRKYFSAKGIANRFIIGYKAVHSLLKIAKEKKVDIIYSNTLGVITGIFAAKKLHLRHIWHVHEIIENPSIFSWLLSKLLLKSNQIIVVSNAVQQYWSKFIPVQKLQLIYNGIDYSPFLSPSSKLRTELNLPNNQLIVGMIGRVHFWKGQDYFLRIAGQLTKTYPNIVFVMIGDAFKGYEFLYKKIETIIQQEAIEHKVFNLGYRNDVHELIQNIDILIVPSIHQDPFPTVILEAMAAGKLVIATNIGGAKEMIIPDETGILIPPDDVNESCKKILPLLSNDNKRLILGKLAKEYVLKNFSLLAFEEKIIKLFS